MTRKEIKEMLPINQAFAEGKTIQDWINDTWKDKEYTSFGELSQSPIKPEPKYRPFQTQEECWDEMLKHQPFGWIKQKENEGKIIHIGYIFEVTNQVLITLSSDVGNVTTSSYLFRAYTFADGSPFGIKDE